MAAVSNGDMMKFFISIALLCVGLLLVSGCGSDDPVVTPETPETPLPEFVIASSDYLNHRFFKLDLPMVEYPGGRHPGDRILPETIKIFQWMPDGPPGPGDITNVAVYVDSLGFRNWDGINFHEPRLFGRRWQEIFSSSWDVMYDHDGNLIALDLRNTMSDQDVLAVIYEVRLADGSTVRVGDFPGFDAPEQEVDGGEGLYYRMKLLKAPVAGKEIHSFLYVLRNIYSLGAANIDQHTFGLRIERRGIVTKPHQDEMGLDYIRIFGLDRDNPQRTGFSDGLVDWWDPFIFDLERGLLKFPLDFPMPFAPGGQIIVSGDPADQAAEAIYAAYADTTAFVWDDTFLSHNQTWQLYDPSVFPSEYPQHSAFRIVATYARPDTVQQ